MAVVGRPEPQWGEVVVAVYVSVDGEDLSLEGEDLSLEDVRECLADKIARY